MVIHFGSISNFKIRMARLVKNMVRRKINKKVRENFTEDDQDAEKNARQGGQGLEKNAKQGG